MKATLKGLSLALIAMALVATAAVAQGSLGQLLTSEQADLVQQKLDAKRQAGLPIDDFERAAEVFAVELEPAVSFSTERLAVLLPSVDEVMELEVEYLAAVEESAGPEAAAKVRDRLAQQLKVDSGMLESAKASSGGRTRVIEVPVVRLGFDK